MAEDNELNETTILFTKIRRAEWAGRLEECLGLIEKFQSLPTEREDNRASNEESNEKIRENDFEPRKFVSFSPQETFYSSVEDTKDRISQLIKEFNKEQKELENELVYLESQNLKATVFRINEYDFALRGYLDKLDLEKVFYKKVRDVSLRYKSQIENDASPDSNDEDDDNGVFTPSWISFSNNFRIKTIIGDFSLFEMKGTWIDGEISTVSASDLRESIKLAFGEKLKEVEPQSGGIDETIEAHGGLPLIGNQS